MLMINLILKLLTHYGLKMMKIIIKIVKIILKIRIKTKSKPPINQNLIMIKKIFTLIKSHLEIFDHKLQAIYKEDQMEA